VCPRRSTPSAELLSACCRCRHDPRRLCVCRETGFPSARSCDAVVPVCPARLARTRRVLTTSPQEAAIGPPSHAAARPLTPLGHLLDTRDTSRTRNPHVQTARPGPIGTDRLSSSTSDMLRQVGHCPGHFSTLQTLFLWTNKSKFQVTCSKSNSMFLHLDRQISLSVI
jgi:hypothetical protein